ncbi:hypothetical protein [Nitrospirillum sp. BR 11828]|uniref:hypothetical protein n=1 Tax=Nitrospirillum sp. BR 11828 TaxID=3104325 RepID=UPI002ACA336C|nr:hypothetical protein [Nitrospirillum sp. BR 11828]MDZ5646525.1 hypothetical protein [Nitrospirillum sp. BR 11828]
MAYWVKRILLKSGELVTERELRQDENLFEGPTPVVGDILHVSCRGRRFTAKVIWGHWPEHIETDLTPLRVEEI